MRTRRTQKKPKSTDSRREWDDWQRYVKKETQRLMQKSDRQVVELDFTEAEPVSTVTEPMSSDAGKSRATIKGGRKPPIPGVPREEALQVSDDNIGRTVKPFTVQDYRGIRPLASAEPIETSEVTEPPESLSSEQVETAVETPPAPPAEEEKPKSRRRGRKKKAETDELALFAGDVSEHQAINRKRLAKRSRMEREELIEKLLDPVISLEEAATLIGVCKTTVRRYTNKGELDCLRTPGQQRRFRLSHVLEFVKKREEDQKTRRQRRGRTN